MKNIDVALRLIDRGIPTAPASPVTKATPNPGGYTQRTTDRQQIDEWNREYPGCCWIFCPVDFDGVAFDVDNITVLYIAHRLGLTGKGYRTNTPSGAHWCYRNTVGIRGGFNISLEDVGATVPPEGGDPTKRLVVRIDRGYIIAPGCVRADGGRYAASGWLSDMAPLPDAVSMFLQHYHDRRPADRVESLVPIGTIDRADSAIDAFNRAHSVTVILERNRYRRIGKRWLAPNSSTGMPGVVILEGKAYSHHGSDVLADGHAHDAFDLFAILEHGGDIRGAVRAAAESLGIAHPKLSGMPDKVSTPVRVWTPRRRSSELGKWGSQFREAMTRP